MSVAIIDYGSGNLHSAHKAFQRAAREAGINKPILVTADPEIVYQAERIVLPGVGAFADAMLDSGALAVVERVEIGGLGGVQRARPNQGAPRSNHVSWFVRNPRVSGPRTAARSTRLRGPMRRRTGW